MSRFWSPIVQTLTPYVPGEQPKIDNLVKLNTNECPYGPSQAVLQAIASQTGDALRLYPDPQASALKFAVAKAHGLMGTLLEEQGRRQEARDLFQKALETFRNDDDDDVLSELDKKRRDYFLSGIDAGQVFITCCDRSSFRGTSGAVTLRIKAGQLKARRELRPKEPPPPPQSV